MSNGNTVSGWDTGLGPVVNVPDGGGQSNTGSSGKHSDPNFPPRITSIAPNLNVSFDNDAGNVNYRPIDLAVKIKVDIPNGFVQPAGVAMCRVEFGSSFKNSSNQDVPPIINAADETVPPNGPPIWRAFNVTASGFDVMSDFGQPGPVTLRLRYSVRTAY